MLTPHELKKRQAKDKTLKIKEVIIACDIQFEGKINIRGIKQRLKVLGLN